jgi:hypothetical protein
MTMLPFKLSIAPTADTFLLTVRGEMAAPDLESGRIAHNKTAGDDQGVAMARSFGDLSHAVWVPVKPAATKGAGELLIIDYWTSADGLRSFFASEPVQQGGGVLYKSREPVVWRVSGPMPRFSLPAPAGRNDRWLGIARGPVKSIEAAETILSAAAAKGVHQSRAKGLMRREWFARLARPGDGSKPEVIGVDVWFDADGMKEVYNDPAEMAGFEGLFTGEPDLSVWQKPKGQWVEW